MAQSDAPYAVPVIQKVQNTIALPPNPVLMHIANAASLFPVIAVPILLILAIIQSNGFFAIIALGALLAAIATETVKYMSRPFLAKYPWLARPKGAKNCGIFNTDLGLNLLPHSRQNPKDSHQTLVPGMPSTHQAVMAFIGVSLMFYFRVGPVAWVTLTAISVLTAWSRVYKGCHTLEQVIAGSIFGITFATLFFNVAPAE